MLRALALFQSIYFVVTALWALVHIRSFMAVTGPKTDIWLVKTVAVMILAVGVPLGVAGYTGHVSREIILMACLAAAGLMSIDVIYVFRRVISPIYLLDAVGEVIILAAWAITLLRK